ncbi:hypothetical protein KUCAC02_024869 [Chaenocephalus aceratus]|nr:hypothetical protein KUCAC02_024869 [Chaenocephalus aceratus]
MSREKGPVDERQVKRVSTLIFPSAASQQQQMLEADSVAGTSQRLLLGERKVSWSNVGEGRGSEGKCSRDEREDQIEVKSPEEGLPAERKVVRG